MTRGTTNAFIDVNAVIEIDIVSKSMDLYPMYGLVGAIAFAHRLQIANIIEENGMAVHASFGGWNTRVSRGFHARVAVTAIDSVVAGVVLVAELDRLVTGDVLIGDIGRPGHHQNCGQGNASKYGNAEQTESCEKIRASVKDLCHVRFAPVSRVLRKGVILRRIYSVPSSAGPGL